MTLTTELIKKIIPIAVWGVGGKMGHHYMDKLIKLGISVDQIIGLDINPENLGKVSSKYPGASYFRTPEAALERGPKVVIMAVNSTEHLGEIIRCYDAGIRKILCEKPLVYYDDQVAELRQHDNSGLYVAHLINFSGIVEDLVRFMIDKNLVLGQFQSVWGKNWPGEKRIMGGDAEEEATHPLALALSLANHSQVVQDIDVVAATSFTPHVQPQYMAEARSLETGFPDTMNDSTVAQFMVHTGTGGVVPVHIMSSFNFCFQQRWVDVGLYRWSDVVSGDINKPPEFKARLDFDVCDNQEPTLKVGQCLGDIKRVFEDRLYIMDAEENRMLVKSTYRGDKIQANLEAALKAFAGKEPDPRLVDFEAAAWLVNLLQETLSA